MAAQIILGPKPSRPAAARHRELRPQPPATNLNALLTASVPPAAGNLPLRGTVSGPQGPASGGTVVACRTDWKALQELHALTQPCVSCTGDNGAACGCGEQVARLLKMLDSRLGECGLVARAPIGPDGTFKLQGLAEGSVALWADVPGLAPGFASTVKAGEARARLALSAGTLFQGRVINEAGEGIPEAVVTGLDLRGRLFDTLTGADGRFDFGPLGVSELTVYVRRAGFLPTQAKLRGAGKAPADIKLIDPRYLRGTVTREGQPVAGAQVTAKSMVCRASATTDASGHFTLEDLQPTSYQLQAREALGWAETEVSIPWLEEGLGEVRLSLEPRGVLEGTVTDASGAPVPEARVWAEWPKRHEVTVRTGKDGRYRLEGLPGGHYSVRAWAQGLVDAPPRVVQVVPGQTVRRDATLERGVTLRGVVRDPSGRPVRESTLSLDGPLHSDGTPMLRSPPPSWTLPSPDERGAFALPGLLPATYRVKVRTAEYDDLDQLVRVPHAPLRLKLRHRGLLVGQVLTPGHAPVSVHLRFHREQPGEERVLPTQEFDLGLSGSSFLAKELASGRYRVEAQVDLRSGEARWWRMVRGQAVVRSGATAQVKLTLPPGQPLSGRLVDARGQPLQGVQLSVSRIEETPDGLLDGGTVRTGEDGRFHIPSLAPGRYAVHAAEQKDFEPVKQEVELRAQEVELVARPRRTVRVWGHVVHPDGSPVTAFRLNGVEVREPTGAFEVPHAEVLKAPWHSSLLFEVPGLAPVRRHLSEEQLAKQEPVEVVMWPTRGVRGVVLDAETSQPIAGAWIRVSEPGARESPLPEEARHAGWACIEGPGRSGQLRTDWRGAFELPEVSAGPLQLTVQDGQHARARVALPTEAREVTVRLERGLPLAGRVTLRGGRGLAGVTVCAAGPGGVYETQSAEDGTFTLSGLSPGRYGVVLYPDTLTREVTSGPLHSGAGQEVEVTVPNGKRLDLEWKGAR